MKTRVNLCICLVLLISPAVVTAADGPYASAQVGASWLGNADFDGNPPGFTIKSEVEFDTGVHLGAAVGYDFGQVRVEGEFGYQSHEFKEFADLEVNGVPMADRDADGDIDAFTFLVNGFYDIDTGTKWTPYLGGGIGFATLEIRDLFVSGIIRGDADETVFAYQVAGGVAYEVADWMVADLGYRFAATTEPDFDGLEEYRSHNLVAAIRFSFP